MPPRFHPAWFAVLIAPYGVAFSYVAYALPFLGGRVGLEVEMTALLGIAYAPHTFKFLWAPLVDTTLTRKAWYWIGLLLTSGGLAAASSIPVARESLPLLTAVVIAAQIGLTFVNFAVESFMALGVREELKGRASGWYWAGSLGFGGLAAGLMLSRPSLTGAAIPVALLLCGLPAAFVPMPPRDADHAPRLGPAFRKLLRDLYDLVRSRAGITGLIIAGVPVSAGVLGNALNGIPHHWGLVDPHHLEVAGLSLKPEHVVGYGLGCLGGVVGAGGALLGGALADRIPRRLNYALAGTLMALTAVGMAMAPREPWAYVTFALIYLFFLGVAQAAFSGFVLETIGRAAVATRYNIFAGFINLAYWYTAKVESVALEKWGATGITLADAAMTGAGILVLLIMVAVTRRGPVTSPSA